MSALTKVKPLEVVTRPDRARVIVVVRGELDIDTVDAVQTALDEMLAAGWTQIVLDPRELTFIDSSGLSVLLAVDRDARLAGATFAIIDGSPVVARLLEIAGLTEHFSRAAVR
jgi:anti-anti-sigma factor